METRGPAAAEKRDSAWSFRRETGRRHLALKSRLPGVSEFFDGHAELTRKRNSLGDRRLGCALFPRRQCLAADPQPLSQLPLIEGSPNSDTGYGPEFCQAIHVPHMVLRVDAVLSRLVIRSTALDIHGGPVAGSCEEGPRCANSRPHGQTLDWRADEMTVACLGRVSLGTAEVVRAGAVNPWSNAAAAEDQP